jgi:hypothetical protein
VFQYAAKGAARQQADASTIARDTADELLLDVRAKELRPLDLTGQPAVQTPVDVVDTDELTA